MSNGRKKDVGISVKKNGVSFRVWAPFADSVAITGSFNDWGQYPLSSEADGYWWGYFKGAKPGQEYKFVIKNGDNTYYRNDPRAYYFTTSSGNSVIPSPYFDWGESTFTPIPPEKQVIYELHVGTFNRPDPSISGNFHDVIAKLDYLQGLGVNMIELMPISSMLMDRGWGYAIDYIFAVESLYGGRSGFLNFVKEAHARGIGVILDVVYNHFGPDSFLDLWQFDGWHEDGKGGIYFYNDWRAQTPWGNTRPDFGRPEVQQYILDNIRMWMHECRVDGLRVDSTIYIRNFNGYNDDPEGDLPEGWKLLQSINRLAKKINPSALTIAEDVGANDYIVKPIIYGGAGFSSQWELDFPHTLRTALKSHKTEEIDLSGIAASLLKKYNGDAFERILFIDSHDSAANGSSRFNSQIAPDNPQGLFARKQTILAAVMLMSTPGIPMIFQGQEIMEGGAFNDWQALDWHKAEAYKGITEAFRHLICLRKNLHGHTSGLTGQNVNILHQDETNKVLLFHRWNNGGPKDDVVVIINFSAKTHQTYETNLPRDGIWTTRFNSNWSGYSADFKDADIPRVEVAGGKAVIQLPPACALILSQDE
ncbi:MAG TPA: alpha-amylase family glycosyl hydrolase [Candidatus Saccharimonadales bacterium]|nr:alpha-amylase family glycosyl hydrolase [Candidatus Saccharimonadales bacterium]